MSPGWSIGNRSTGWRVQWFRGNKLLLKNQLIRAHRRCRPYNGWRTFWRQGFVRKTRACQLAVSYRIPQGLATDRFYLNVPTWHCQVSFARIWPGETEKLNFKSRWPTNNGLKSECFRLVGLTVNWCIIDDMPSLWSVRVKRWARAFT